jgi:hypothetical protein
MSSDFSSGERISKFQGNICFIAFLFTEVFVLCVTLSPFKFSPTNGAQWLSKDAGLYFNGNGIIYSKRSQEGYSFSCGQAISVEIYIKERHGSNNSGPREIISLYDGVESPPLLIGMWSGQIFLYSRFEQQSGHKWYNQFRPKNNIHQGEEYYITAVYGKGNKAIYCNGKLVEEQAANFPLAGHEKLYGRIIVGSSPFCKNGWMGEIRGIALYNYALSSSEVSNHYAIICNQGVGALADIQGLCGLYDFHDKNGHVVQNIAGAAPSLYIPEVYSPVRKTILYNPRNDMRFGQEWIDDFALNAFLFIPSGFLLAQFFSYMMSGRLAVFLSVCLVCAGISFSIEIAQIFIPARYPGIYDVFANVLGAGTGASLNVALSIIRSLK